MARTRHFQTSSGHPHLTFSRPIMRSEEPQAPPRKRSLERARCANKYHGVAAITCVQVSGERMVENVRQGPPLRHIDGVTG